MRIAKVGVFLLALLPFLLLLFDILSGNIVDPIEEITNPTGQWSLRMLIITLCISPLVLLTKKYFLLKFRRMLGLFAFFYMVLHLGIWLIDQQFNIEYISEDIMERTYILLGFVAFLFTTALAVTSNNYSIQKLGIKWKYLHKSVYAIIILGWVHLFMQSKSGWELEVMIYLTIIIILLGFRFKKD